MKRIRIIVYGEPKPMPRARAYIKGDRAGVYNPATANDWKAAIRDAALPVVPATPLQGPLRVDARFFLKRPQRLMRKKDPAGPVWAFAGRRNDRDNLDKAVLDVLTDVGMWCDDAQVCAGELLKMHASKDGRSGCIITISQMLGAPCPELDAPLRGEPQP